MQKLKLEHTKRGFLYTSRMALNNIPRSQYGTQAMSHIRLQACLNITFHDVDSFSVEDKFMDKCERHQF